MGWGELLAEGWWAIGLLAALAMLAGFLAWWPVRTALRNSRLADARREFHHQRERLEAKFMQLAIANTKPAAPRWIDCDFDDDVAYVRNRSTGELAAFVAITVAIEGLESDSGNHGDPPKQGSELIGNLRMGTAVFRFAHTHWETDGVALLNLSPSEAVRFYQDNLEIVGQE